MRPLELVCKSCGTRFESGVPLQRGDLEGVKLGALEVCPACGAVGEYRNEDYLEPVAPDALSPGRGGIPGAPV